MKTTLSFKRKCLSLQHEILQLEPGKLFRPFPDNEIRRGSAANQTHRCKYYFIDTNASQSISSDPGYRLVICVVVRMETT
jgi:hypothetical protein